MTCARLWEVEAARDGRLDAEDRARHARHCETCAECRREAARLSAVAEALRASTEGPRDEVAARRARGRMLAAASAPPARRIPPLLVLAPLLALAVLVGVILRRATRTVPPAGVAATVHPHPDTQWTRALEGDVDRVVLTEGTLSVAVGAPKRARLVVVLPDGTLEDVGTRFVVAVHEGRTTHVEVHEGVVVLRLVGQPERVLTAGARWEAPQKVAAPTIESVVVASVTPQPAPSAVAAPPSTSPVGAAGKPPVAPAASASADPGDEAWKLAMAAFRGGDASEAHRLFTAFASAHPGHPKAEDAAYLRILAAQRAHDDKAARAAATDYLARFPKGFRRPEAEAVRDAP